MREEITDLRKELAYCKLVKDAVVDTSNSMGKHYASHMRIAEREIQRLNVIINYLEAKK